MGKSNKIKQLITVENRISLFQTAMNNSGRNFAGKGVKVKKLSAFASDLYKAAIKEIESIGNLSVEQMQLTFKKALVRKQVKKADMGKLMRKVKKKQNGNGKRRVG